MKIYFLIFKIIHHYFQFFKNLASLVNPSNCNILKKNLKLFIDVCGDKLLNEYDSNDYEKFKLFLFENNLNSQEIIRSISKSYFIGLPKFKYYAKN